MPSMPASGASPRPTVSIHLYGADIYARAEYAHRIAHSNGRHYPEPFRPRSRQRRCRIIPEKPYRYNAIICLRRRYQRQKRSFASSAPYFLSSLRRLLRIIRSPSVCHVA